MSDRLADASVFVEGYDIEKAGHVAHLWSDHNRRSWGSCSCGWTGDAAGAERLLDDWRAHVAEDNRGRSAPAGAVE